MKQSTHRLGMALAGPDIGSGSVEMHALLDRTPPLLAALSHKLMHGMLSGVKLDQAQIDLARQRIKSFKNYNVDS